MNKIISLLIIISLAGCGGSYNAEKAYWHFMKNHKDTIKNPADAQQAEFDISLNGLREIIEKYPTWDKSADIQFMIGRMCLEKKNYDKARQELTKVYVNYPQNPKLSIKAQFLVGNIYEFEENWKAALENYEQIRERYPDSYMGLQIPLYVARYYAKKGLQEEAERAHMDAKRIYENKIDINPYGKMVPAYHNLLVLSFGGLEKWDDALEYLDKFLERYPKTDGAPFALYMKAVINKEIKKDIPKTLDIMAEISEKYPDSEYAKKAEYLTLGLTLLKGDMDTARDGFDEISKRYPDDVALNAASQYRIAYSYYKAGEWDIALEMLGDLQQEYPDTMEALESYLVIADKYLKGNNMQEASIYYNKAVARYKSIISEQSGKKIALTAHYMLARTYERQEKFEQAISVLNDIKDKYADEEYSKTAILSIASIYDKYLNRSDKAIEIYGAYLDKYPKDPRSKMIKKILEKKEAGNEDNK